jgi:hypothetical protein
MHANRCESEKSGKSCDSVEPAKASTRNKAVKQTKLSLPLNLVAALILICNVVLPAQAEGVNPTEQTQSEKTETNNWQILSDKIEYFGHLVPTQVEKLFGASQIVRENKPEETPGSRQVIQLDKNTELQLTATRFQIDEIVLMPTSPDSKYLYNKCANDDAEQDWKSDADYTYAPRQEESVYWSTVKANLKNFIGMDKIQLRHLLGPERCSSQSQQTVDYRIGNQRLRFYLNNDRVSFLKLITDKYGNENWFLSKITPAKPHPELWQIFQTQIDRLPGMTSEQYDSLVQNSREKEAANSKSAQSSSNRPRQRDYKTDKWQLDDRISSTVFLQRGFVQSIDFEPIEITEDSKLAHGLVLTGWGCERPSDKDAIYTGAKRRDEATYWAAIKPNLQKLIGMKRQEILALLGPERCSSEAGKSIDYRVGNSRLRFFLRNGAVIGFELENDMYLHDT